MGPARQSKSYTARARIRRLRATTPDVSVVIGLCPRGRTGRTAGRVGGLEERRSRRCGVPAGSGGCTGESGRLIAGAMPPSEGRASPQGGLMDMLRAGSPQHSPQQPQRLGVQPAAQPHQPQPQVRTLAGGALLAHSDACLLPRVPTRGCRCSPETSPPPPTYVGDRLRCPEGACWCRGARTLRAVADLTYSRLARAALEPAA